MLLIKKVHVFYILFQITVQISSFSTQRAIERLTYLERRINDEAKFRGDDYAKIMNKLNNIQKQLKVSLNTRIDVIHVEKETCDMNMEKINEIQSDFSRITTALSKEKAKTTGFRKQFSDVKHNLITLKKEVENYCNFNLNTTDHLITQIKESKETRREATELYSDIVTSSVCSALNNISESVQSVNFNSKTFERNIENKLNDLEIKVSHGVENISEKHDTLVKMVENNTMNIDKVMGLLTKTLDSMIFCGQSNDGDGWTIFQRRLDGSVNFYRNWSEYKEGFGDLNGEFWLGNDLLSILTAGEDKELRIELEDFDGSRAYAHYSKFKIYPEKEKFILEVDGYNGTAGDGLDWINGMPFSTFDNDNDNEDSNCAEFRRGVWWYHACSFSNLNGRYKKNGKGFPDGGVFWWEWKGHDSLKRTIMK